MGRLWVGSRECCTEQRVVGGAYANSFVVD